MKTPHSSGFWLMRNWRKLRSRRSRMETSWPGTPAGSRKSPAAACWGSASSSPAASPGNIKPPNATSLSRLPPRSGCDVAVLAAPLRPAYHNARAEGWAVNHEKMQCLWREQGLRVPGAEHTTAVCVERLSFAVDQFTGPATATRRSRTDPYSVTPLGAAGASRRAGTRISRRTRCRGVRHRLQDRRCPPSEHR